MRFDSISPAIKNDIISLIHTSPWRIFDRGIFVPCEKLADSALTQIYEKQQFNSEYSFAYLDDNNNLKGVLFAKELTIDDKPAIGIFILEADRDDNFKQIVEDMLNELHRRAKSKAITTLQLTPSQPLSSAVNIKDDELVDILFKMGYWQNITIAAEMRTEVSTWRPSEKIINREKELREKGIVFRKLQENDWDAIIDFHEREHAHRSWTSLLEDVINEVGHKYIVIAEDINNKKIIGYATFFARTMFSELPEFGPVMVDPEYRGLSISSILMKYAVEMIKEIGKARQIQLSCYPNKFPVYTRQGYYFTHKYIFAATSKIK